jgi:hypothetical protein
VPAAHEQRRERRLGLGVLERGGEQVALHVVDATERHAGAYASAFA